MAGYLRQRVAPMDATRCAEMLADLATIDAKITTPDFKGPRRPNTARRCTRRSSTSAATPGRPERAAAPPVADATHYGPVRYSRPIDLEDPLAFLDAAKTTYAGPAGGSSCGANYIILIGNTWPNQEYGTDTNAAPYPTNPLMSRLGHDPGAQIYPSRCQQRQEQRPLRRRVGTFPLQRRPDGADGQQNIRMFTIDVYNRTPDAAQGELLKSIADTNGPGGYYSVGGDLYGLIAAFTDVLTQIASINSVFASASLPVSVNAQGTFLNQVFMGVFRPDGDGYQRWAGNLKQYKFALSGNTLFLADANGAPAVDSVSTGFIQNCATSYWTADSGDLWQSITGSRSRLATRTTARRIRTRPTARSSSAAARRSGCATSATRRATSGPAATRAAGPTAPGAWSTSTPPTCRPSPASARPRAPGWSTGRAA